MIDARGQKGQHAPAMGEDELDVGAARQHAIQHEAGDGARGVQRKLDALGGKARNEAGGAGMGGGMHIDDRLAPVQLLEHRRERGIAQRLAVIVREQADSIGLQGVEGIFDLLQRAFGVGRRHHGEKAEAGGVIVDGAGGAFVPVAREAARGPDVAEPDPGGGDRADGAGDAMLVHHLDGLFGRPAQEPLRRGAGVLVGGVALLLFLHIGARQEMVVHVDAARRHSGHGLCFLIAGIFSPA